MSTKVYNPPSSEMSYRPGYTSRSQSLNRCGGSPSIYQHYSDNSRITSPSSSSSRYNNSNDRKPASYTNTGSRIFPRSTDSHARPPSGHRPLPPGGGPLVRNNNKLATEEIRVKRKNKSVTNTSPSGPMRAVHGTSGRASPVSSYGKISPSGRSPSVDSFNSYNSLSKTKYHLSTENLNKAHERSTDLHTGKDISSIHNGNNSLPRIPSQERLSRRDSVNRPSSGSRASSLSKQDSVERLLKSDSYKYDTNNNNRGLMGLRNLGNTCYMNCMLQGLANTRLLLELIKSGELERKTNPRSRMHGSLVKAFASLVRKMWGEGGGSGGRSNSLYSDHVSPTEFRAELTHYARRFAGYQQQDAQEFLIYVLEGLHEDVNRVTSKVPKEMLSNEFDSKHVEVKAIESWRWYQRYDDSHMVDLFVGQLKSSLQCQDCKHVSNTFDPFWEIPLPLRKQLLSGQDLGDCFDEFTREETMDGDERPTCERCKKRQRCKKKFTIWRFPPVLILHLKRFDPMAAYPTKLSTKVNFPVTGLDLSPYADHTDTGESCIYDLYSVSNHSGTALGGHYTAYTRHPYSGQWHHFNDQHCTSISENRVVSSEAYVLFYEKRQSGSQPRSRRLSNL